MTIPKIIMYKGQSQYDVLRYFVDDLAEGFREYNYDVIIIDLVKGKQALIELFEILQEGQVFFIFSFNGIGSDITLSEGRRLHEQIDIPFFSFFVDHPIYHVQRLRKQDKSSKNNQHMYSFLDFNQATFAKDHLMNSSTAIALPHAASHINGPDLELKAVKDREIDMFMPGGYGDPEETREMWKDWSSPLANMMEQVIECALAYPSHTLQQSFEQVLSSKGFLFDTFYNDKSYEFLRIADTYLRRRFRHDLVLALKNENIFVAGNGWEKFKNAKQKIRISPALPYPEMLRTMQNSKLVVNAFSTYNQYSHERVFDTAAAGAVSMTLPSPYFENTFKAGENILFFKDIEDAAQVASKSLAAPDSLQNIADNGRSLVLTGHQWRHRAANILEAVFIHTNLVG
ncbi:glycosyltransferase family protein [Paenibacillus sp. Z6-24]